MLTNNLYTETFSLSRQKYVDKVLPHIMAGNTEQAVQSTLNQTLKNGYGFLPLFISKSWMKRVSEVLTGGTAMEAFVSTSFIPRLRFLVVTKPDNGSMPIALGHELHHLLQDAEYGGILESNLPKDRQFLKLFTTLAMAHNKVERGTLLQQLKALGPEYVSQAKQICGVEISAYGNDSAFFHRLPHRTETHLNFDELMVNQFAQLYRELHQTEAEILLNPKPVKAVSFLTKYVTQPFTNFVDSVAKNFMQGLHTILKCFNQSKTKFT